MDKLQKFYKLKQCGFPCPDFKEYNGENLTGNELWSIRCSLVDNEETSLSLDKVIGVFSDLATSKAREFKDKYGNKAIIFYYKYFIARASGILSISEDMCYTEIIKGDLWKIKKGERIDSIATYKNEKMSIIGNTEIMPYAKIFDLFSYAKLTNLLIDCKKIYLEWSLTNEDEILFYDFSENNKL